MESRNVKDNVPKLSPGEGSALVQNIRKNREPLQAGAKVAKEHRGGGEGALREEGRAGV